MRYAVFESLSHHCVQIVVRRLMNPLQNLLNIHLNIDIFGNVSKYNLVKVAMIKIVKQTWFASGEMLTCISFNNHKFG